MRWRRTGTDDSGIEDRRGQSPQGGMQFPGGAMGKGAGGLGIVGVIVVLLVVFLGGGSGGTGFGIPTPDLPAQPAATGNDVANGPDSDANLKAFVAFVVHDVQASWAKAFTAAGRQYQPTVLVLFTGGVNTGLRFGLVRRRALLLPGRHEGLHRPGLLPGAARPLRRARRLRPGLRDRPRGRPPRAEPAGHLRRGGPGAAPRPEQGERAVGAAGAAGRLPRRASGPTPPTRDRSWRPATSRRA